MKLIDDSLLKNLAEEAKESPRLRNDYEAEITIKDGIVTGSLPRRALRLVYEWLDLHRDELMENWERLTNSEAAKKIEPLK